MGWQTITHSCGHDTDHQLYGKHSDRDSKASWLAEQPCTDCWKKEQQEARKIENKKAAIDNKILGLPPLMGSEKQIAWAESIRKPIIDTMLSMPVFLEGDGNFDNDKKNAREELLKIWEDYKNKLKNQQSAKWWIDNRTSYTINNGRLYYNCVSIVRWVAEDAIKNGLAPLASAYMQSQQKKEVKI